MISLVPQRLPRFYFRQEQLEDARRIARIILETGGLPDEVDDSKPSSRLTRGADGHDWRRRRGLPMVGKGISGAMPGTNPLGALIAKERGRRP